MVTRDSFAASLCDVSDVNEHYSFIDRHAAAGDRAALKEIFIELYKPMPRSRVPEWVPGAILDRIIEALALTDGYDNAVAALELTGIANSGPKGISTRSRPPAVTSKIVAAHSTEVIDALLRTLNDLHTRALLLHEAVVHRKLSADSSVGPEIQGRLAEAQHPLAVLPLTLFDLECDALLPKYGIGSSATSMPFGPFCEPLVISSRPSASAETAEITSPDRASLISAAVLNWKDESNGQIEARTFRIPLSNRIPLPTLLSRLGLESVGGTAGVHVREKVLVKDIFTILFSAASNGGAYNSGNYGAYGRLLAWQSLAGLVGASSSAPLHAIANDCDACQWCLFHSQNQWYYEVAWDIGIACFNSARQEVAVLAATDTD